MDDFLWDKKSLDKDVFITLPTKPKKTPEDVLAYASFGDDDTTATVNQYGNLMQISRFLDFGSSGFLCVDSGYKNPPYFVQERMDELINSLKDRTKGLRLHLVDWNEFQSVPSLGFMHDRWPRYIFKMRETKEQPKHSGNQLKSSSGMVKSTNTKSTAEPVPEFATNTAKSLRESNETTAKPAAFPLSVQYFCSQGAVVQKYLLNIGEDGIPLDKVKWEDLSLRHACGVSINDLNFETYSDFNNPRKKLDTVLVSDHHLVIRHDFEDLNKSSGIEKYREKTDPYTAAALIITPLINGDHATIDKKHCIKLTKSHLTESKPTESQSNESQSDENQSNERQSNEIQLTEAQATETPLTESQPTKGRLEITLIYRLKLLKRGTFEEALDSDQFPDSSTGQMQNGDTTEMDIPPTDHITVPSVADEAVFKTHEDVFNEDLWTVLTRETIGTRNAMGMVFREGNPFRKISFSQNRPLDFAFRRNLEHILSVCSITTGSSTYKQPRIAITCGDIAGHRVGPRASLSAVQFLSSMLTYLNPDNEDSKELRSKNKKVHPGVSEEQPTGKTSSIEPENKDATQKPRDWEENDATDSALDPDHAYLKELHERVRRVLDGHFMWICTRAETWKDGAFAPHYWPTGRSIEDISYLPSPSLIDTPLQLLKILQIFELYRDKVPEQAEEQKPYQDLLSVPQTEKLRSKVCKWIEELHKANERGTYAFSRNSRLDYVRHRNSDDSTVLKYSLTDHVMIGMALKCVEKLGLSPKDEEGESPEKTVWSYYTYDEVKQKSLKRFTTVGPDSKQRMLATSRWSDGTRFLLHAKDTYLFFAANMDYFNQFKNGTTPSSRMSKGAKLHDFANAWRYVDERWNKLLDAQSSHDEFRYLDWNKPLWYMLVHVLVSKGRRINNQSSETMIKEVHNVLLDPSWYNGLFPGSLGQKRKPILHEREEDRDEYWFCTFEIPNILWTFGTDETSVTTKQSSNSSSNRTATESSTGPKDVMGYGQQVAKYVPFVSLSLSKDQITRNIVSDDWLQQSPAILNFETTSNSDSTQNITDQRTDQRTDQSDTKKRLESILDKFQTKLPEKQLGVVIDIPGYSLGSGMSTEQIDGRDRFQIESKRTVWISKKRIIWLSSRNKDTARMVYNAASGIEKENVLSFLERHSNFETYFLDSATATLNEWETELHLSYFRTCDREGEELKCLKGQRLARTAMSFRFSGDFSDRYWTCYFLEHGTKGCIKESLGLRLIPGKDCIIRGDLGLKCPKLELGPAERRIQRAESKKGEEGSISLRAWQQRRVLELLIYSKMLEELYEDTAKILSSIKEFALHSNQDHSLGLKVSPFTAAINEAKLLQEMGSEDDYSSLAAQWREYAQILDVIEENLTDNIERIRQWDRRKDDRRSGQPRWTDRDNQNHSATILRLTILCQRQAGDVERLKSAVLAFRESLLDRLEMIRNDIVFRDSQNINLFTYVTVVFLPLGFATGILSMSGAPEHSVLVNLVTLAFGALGITLFALLNAKAIKMVVTSMIRQYYCGTGILWKFATYAFFYAIKRKRTYRYARHQQWKKQHAGKPPSKRQSIKKQPGQNFEKGLSPQQLVEQESSATRQSSHRLKVDEQESPILEHLSQAQQRLSSAPVDPRSSEKKSWRERGQAKLDEIRKFSYQEAVQNLQTEIEKQLYRDTSEDIIEPQILPPPSQINASPSRDMDRKNRELKGSSPQNQVGASPSRSTGNAEKPQESLYQNNINVGSSNETSDAITGAQEESSQVPVHVPPLKDTSDPPKVTEEPSPQFTESIPPMTWWQRFQRIWTKNGKKPQDQNDA